MMRPEQPVQPRVPVNAPANHYWRCIVHALRFAVLVVLGGIALGIYDSGYFKVREVIVRSKSQAVAEEIASILQVPSDARTLFFPAKILIEQAKTSPRVLEAHVISSPPNRVTVNIIERVSCFAVHMTEDYGMLDRYGVLIEHNSQPGPDYPVLIGPVLNEQIVGNQLDAVSLNAILDCMAGAASANFGKHFILDIRHPFEYKMFTPTGTLVLLGNKDNLTRKVIIAATAEKRLRARKERARYIDVRLPSGDVYWKPMNAPAQAIPTS